MRSVRTGRPALRYHAIHDVQVQVLLHVHLHMRNGCEAIDSHGHRASR
jgi:hypothetical protein